MRFCPCIPIRKVKKLSRPELPRQKEIIQDVKAEEIVTTIEEKTNENKNENIKDKKSINIDGDDYLTV